jgi:hypothetical protein
MCGGCLVHLDPRQVQIHNWIIINPRARNPQGGSTRLRQYLERGPKLQISLSGSGFRHHWKQEPIRKFPVPTEKERLLCTIHRLPVRRDTQPFRTESERHILHADKRKFRSSVLNAIGSADKTVRDRQPVTFLLRYDDRAATRQPIDPVRISISR